MAVSVNGGIILTGFSIINIYKPSILWIPLYGTANMIIQYYTIWYISMIFPYIVSNHSNSTRSRDRRVKSSTSDVRRRSMCRDRGEKTGRFCLNGKRKTRRKIWHAHIWSHIWSLLWLLFWNFERNWQWGCAFDYFNVSCSAERFGEVSVILSCFPDPKT